MLIEERIAVALGFVTIISALAAFVTCRSFIDIIKKLGLKDPLQAGWYKRLYRFHGIFWPVAWSALGLHLVLAMIHTQLPQFGDLDALIHLYILGGGLLSLIAMAVLGFSCRVFGVFVNARTGKAPLQYRLFGPFYQRHGFYWAVFFGIFAVHFFFAHLHIGFWPSGM